MIRFFRPAGPDREKEHDAKPQSVRRHIIFSGRVQGVGFRYRAVKAAEMYGCTGWVRNDWNGTVTMEIQGTEAKIGRVIRAIEKGSYIRIENMQSRLIPVEEKERHFTEVWD